jgi:hypothetical protein
LLLCSEVWFCLERHGTALHCTASLALVVPLQTLWSYFLASSMAVFTCKAATFEWEGCCFLHGPAWSTAQVVHVKQCLFDFKHGSLGGPALDKNVALNSIVHNRVATVYPLLCGSSSQSPAVGAHPWYFTPPFVNSRNIMP